MEYLIAKYIHIVSSTLLFGTGLGSAFYKWRADKSGDIPSIAFTNRNVVVADWWFTTPSIIVQPLSGIAMILLAGFAWTSPWLLASVGLYLVAGACWIPVVKLQMQMRDISDRALTDGTELSSEYAVKVRQWFWLGVPAFTAIMVVFYMMVARPTLALPF